MAISPTHSLAGAEDRKVKPALMPSGAPRITRKNKDAFERTEQIIEEVYVDITNGESKSSVVRKLKLGLYSAQDGKVSKDHNYPYEVYNAAMARMREDADIKKDDLKSLVYGQFLAVYNEAVQVGDRQSALRALEQMAKLNGLYDNPQPTTAIQLNTSGNVNVDFGFLKKENNDETELSD